MHYLVFFSGLFIALAYLPITSRKPSWSRSALKTAPVLLFALAGFLAQAPALIVVGLFLSALGDFGLSRDGDGAFLYGLSAFALAHLVYILGFTGISGLQAWEGFVVRPVPAIILAALIVSTEVWLATHTKKLQLPVRIYVLIIGAMGLAALTLDNTILMLGAGLFIVSDVILAVQLFRMREDHSHHATAGYGVWVFYVAAQALICWGIFP